MTTRPRSLVVSEGQPVQARLLRRRISYAENLVAQGKQCHFTNRRIDLSVDNQFRILQKYSFELFSEIRTFQWEIHWKSLQSAKKTEERTIASLRMEWGAELGVTLTSKLNFHLWSRHLGPDSAKPYSTTWIWRCHVEAYPPPAITWLKDDVQLSNNQHYSVSHFATADQFTDTTIRVITIEKRQYGEYMCRAANKLGTAETKVELFGNVNRGFHANTS